MVETKLMFRRLTIYIILAASLAVNVLSVAYGLKTGAVDRFLLETGRMSETSSRNQVQRELDQRYSGLPSVQHGILFIGDSLTYNAPYSDVLTVVHNRGIPGDTSADLISRLPDLRRNRADYTVVQIGINDLLHRATQDNIVYNISYLLDNIAIGDGRLIVLGIYPVDSQFVPPPTTSNSDIRILNAAIMAEVKKHHGMRFCDLTPILIDKEGDLRQEFTADGIHLSPLAYSNLIPYIKQITSLEIPKFASESIIGTVCTSF